MLTSPNSFEDVYFVRMMYTICRSIFACIYFLYQVQRQQAFLLNSFSVVAQKVM